MTVIISSINFLEHEPVIAKPLMRELRRADDFIRLAVSSVYEVLAGRLPIDEQEACDWGLVVGTSFGPMETNFDVLDQIVSNEQTSPTLFSHSVFNGAAGYLTRIFNIRGNTTTLTDFYYPFFQALSHGYTLINSGRVKYCVVLQVETYSRLLHDARASMYETVKDQWPMGGAAWLLEGSHSGDNPLAIHSIKIELTPNWKSGYPGTNDILNYNGETETISHPLAAPIYLSDKLNNHGNQKHHHFQIFSDNGNIVLQIDGPNLSL